MKKISVTKKLIPAYIFNETEKQIIRENYDYILTPIILGGKTIHCLEFKEDAFNILDDLECNYLLEADMSTAEKRGIATRISTLAFQCVREMSFINGSSLIELGKSLKVVARCIALAVVVGIANIDLQSARRLIPLIRAI